MQNVEPREEDLSTIITTVLAVWFSKEENSAIFDANITYAQVCKRCALEFQHCFNLVGMWKRGLENTKNNSIGQPLEYPKRARLPPVQVCIPHEWM